MFNFVNIETVIGLCNQANSGNYNLFLIVCNPYGQKLTLRQPPQQNILSIDIYVDSLLLHIVLLQPNLQTT